MSDPHPIPCAQPGPAPHLSGQDLSIRDLHKTYPGAEEPVFQGFNLDVPAGTLCAVVGISGSGKTTLLNCIAALDGWERGEILAGGVPVPRGNPLAGALHRRQRIGLAFQQPHLLPEFTLQENLEMPLRIDGDLSPAQQDWIRQLLEAVGLERLAHRHPNTLSGGQAARAGLARALARKPALWLLDEPTGNLDPATSKETFTFLMHLHQELRPTTLLVTHTPSLAERCERIVELGKKATGD